MAVLPKPPGTIIFPVRAGIPIPADFYVPVGSTGIVFVAKMQGISTKAGPPIFTQEAQDAAYLRAGSTLARMGIIRAETFAFLRQSIRQTVTQVATLLGVSEQTVVDWESGVQTVPRDYWMRLANEVCRLDHRPLDGAEVIRNPFRGRSIRIYPDAPQTSSSVLPVPPPC